MRIIKFRGKRPNGWNYGRNIRFKNNGSVQILGADVNPETVGQFVGLYDKNGKELARLDGYLDIGLNDTMEDLIVNFIGAITFNVFGFIYLKNRDKDRIVKNFIIKNKKIESDV